MLKAEAQQETTASSDFDVLRRLNNDYIQAVEGADPSWFDMHLAPDFLNSNPDGSIVDRKGFLEQVARGAGVSGIEAHDVQIRVMGSLGIVHARTTYRTPSGKMGAGRYTDVWLCRQGRWLCVAAQVTRC